jgi:2-keto-4-pentenoate hydratase/2-oxohepta-3-ene-1,7-dioic acid hydratase in catechol pathway
MRWVTYVSPQDGREHPGLLQNGVVHGYRGADRLIDLLGDRGERLAAAALEARADPLESVPLAEAALRAPIPVPPSIRDFMSFEEHVVTSMQAIGFEVDPSWYEYPVFYFTNPAAVKGPSDGIAISPGSAEFDFELEIGAVIGRDCTDVSPADAEDYIAGYTIICDWSARDLQTREMRQSLGPAKGKDSATTLGPALVTPDELHDLRAGKGFDIKMRAWVNGRLYSTGNWKDIYWSFGQMVSYASRGTRLVPGDVIGSGTVGTGCILELSRVHGASKYPWLRAGDEVRLEIDELGAIETRISPGGEVVPLR